MKELLKRHIEDLTQNSYSGRGIVIGLSPDESIVFQIYWIMGRSENSRNRIFVMEENGAVKNEAYDESKLTDPSLIIYYPIKSLDKVHIVSNGDQTDTIFDKISIGGSFEEALRERTYEPDAPNFTPRISGIVDLNDTNHTYKLSILKSLYNNPAVNVRNIFSYDQAIPGVGHCITTYSRDGAPLPSFQGEPLIVPIFNSTEENLNYYWSLLNEDNRISILVKSINRESNQFNILIKNKLFS
ncbi:IMP cyclohydrolase [Cohnella sp.]|uniref:IMP cyclohydrolase n=1 Tax=Cohnella sp. TaxID=1883426 RepID=UPI00356AB0F0